MGDEESGKRLGLGCEGDELGKMFVVRFKFEVQEIPPARAVQVNYPQQVPSTSIQELQPLHYYEMPSSGYLLAQSKHVLPP